MVEWIKLAVGAIFIAGCVAACHERDMRLIEQGETQQIAKEQAQRERDQIANQKKEDDHKAAIASIDAQRVKEKQDHEKIVAGLQRDVRDGRERLRIATLRKPPQVPSDPAAGRAEPEEGSVLMPEAAADVLGVAGGIEQTVRDYNALLDAYHALELECRK